MVWPDIQPEESKIQRVFQSPPPPKGKKIEMTVMWGSVARAYQVITIKNTTWYRPGTWLTEEIVAKVCELPDWTVTLVADDLWKNVFNFIGGKLPGISV